MLLSPETRRAKPTTYERRGVSGGDVKLTFRSVSLFFPAQNAIRQNNCNWKTGGKQSWYEGGQQSNLERESTFPPTRKTSQWFRRGSILKYRSLEAIIKGRPIVVTYVTYLLIQIIVALMMHFIRKYHGRFYR